MISDTILHKYLRQFRLMDGTRFYHIDAIELAFRLAFDELEQSIPSTPSTPSTELVALQANQLATLQAELERLQTAANAEVAELRQQIAQMDADNAAMIRRNGELISPLRTWIASAYPQHAIITDDERLSEVVAKLANEMRIEIVTLRRQIAIRQADLERLQTATNAEVAELRQQIAQMDADNAAMIRRNRELVAALDIATGAVPVVAKPVAILTNGTINGTAITTAPPAAIHHTTLNDFASANLTPENYDWWIGLDAGRHIWRNLPKRNRLDLVRYVLSFGPPNAVMKMVEFDAIRPEWMPTAGTHTKTFNMTWEQLNDFTVELEATR